MVKIGRRNNVSIRNRLSVVADHRLCDGDDHFHLRNDHFVDEEDGRSDERDGRSHQDGGPDGDDHFCSEEDRVGCESDLFRRKGHGIRDANHHPGGKKDALGRQEDALYPTDRAVGDQADVCKNS